MKTPCAAKQVLIHGMIFILVGLVWGLAVPKTPFPRLALSAHIQFEQSGIMFILIAILLLKLPNNFGCKSMVIILLTVWLTWLMALSEAANAWWGTTQMLPLAAHEAGATGGTPWQELTIKLTHITSGVALIVTWILLIIGFAKTPFTPADQ